MGQHHVEAWPELLPGPPDRALVLQTQDKVTTCVMNGLKCLGIVGRILLHSMFAPSDARRVQRQLETQRESLSPTLRLFRFTTTSCVYTAGVAPRFSSPPAARAPPPDSPFPNTPESSTHPCRSVILVFKLILNGFFLGFFSLVIDSASAVPTKGSLTSPLLGLLVELSLGVSSVSRLAELPNVLVLGETRSHPCQNDQRNEEKYQLPSARVSVGHDPITPPKSSILAGQAVLSRGPATRSTWGRRGPYVI